MSMESNTKNPLSTNDQQASLFSERELELIKHTRETGMKAIAPSLSSQMFQLFLEGYSCAEIAKMNPPFGEGDILICREKFNWDKEKDLYIMELQNRVKDKLLKTKLESLDFLTNTLSASHKYYNQKMLKYIQTGKEDDKPENLIAGPKAYKDIVESITKLTGEDRITTQNINKSVVVETKKSDSAIDITPQDRKEKLKKLIENK